MADQVLCEWALSDDEVIRFDALGLISDLKMHAAVPALRRLGDRLRKVRSPSAPFELQKVQRIIGEIDSLQ